MRRVHLAAGILLFAIFLISGAFMKWELAQGGALDPVYRMVHRSRHIYILFGALLQILFSLAWKNQEGWRMWTQRLSSGLVLLAGILFPVAFVVEPELHRITAPVTFYGVLSALIGVVLTAITHMRINRNEGRKNGLSSGGF